MSLVERVRGDLQEALRRRDELRKSTLRLLLSEIQKEGKKKGGGGDVVEDDTVVRLVRRAIKARREAAEHYRQGGCPERAEQEEAEEAVLEGYLPALLDEEATRELVRRTLRELGATDRSQTGKVMGRIMSSHRAQLDGALVKRLVDEALATGGAP